MSEEKRGLRAEGLKPEGGTPETCNHSKHYVTVEGKCCGCGVQMLAQEGVVVEPFPRRPTPNTDCAYRFKARVSENPCEPNEHSEYMTSLCRVLERQRDEGWQERDEARAAWTARDKAIHEIQGIVELLQQERDEARQAASDKASEVYRTRGERNEWLACAEKLAGRVEFWEARENEGFTQDADALAVFSGVGGGGAGGGDTAATGGGDFDTLPECVDGGDMSLALELFEEVGKWLVEDQPVSAASRRVWRAYEKMSRAMLAKDAKEQREEA